MPEAPKPVVLIVRDGWGENPNPEHDAFNAVKLARTPRHRCADGSGTPSRCSTPPARTSACPKTRWATPRSATRTSAPAGSSIRSRSGSPSRSAPARSTTTTRSATRSRTPTTTATASTCWASPPTPASTACSTHLYGCVKLCKQRGVPTDKILLHLFTDGRDTGPFTGKGFIEQIEAQLADIGAGRIASICGRYYAMDRDNRWERVQQAYDLLTGRGTGEPSFSDRGRSHPGLLRQPHQRLAAGRRVHHPATVGKADKPCHHRRRHRHLLQLPRRPPARDHPRLHAARLPGQRPPVARLGREGL